MLPSSIPDRVWLESFVAIIHTRCRSLQDAIYPVQIRQPEPEGGGVVAYDNFLSSSFTGRTIAVARLNLAIRGFVLYLYIFSFSWGNIGGYCLDKFLGSVPIRTKLLKVVLKCRHF